MTTLKEKEIMANYKKLAEIQNDSDSDNSNSVPAVNLKQEMKFASLVKNNQPAKITFFRHIMINFIHFFDGLLDKFIIYYLVFLFFDIILIE